MTTTILIHFEPEYRVEAPPLERFTGKVQVLLPEVHVKLLDLSMGIRELDGAHVGGDGRIWALNLDLGDEGLSAEDMMRFLRDAEPQIREMHRITQEEMDKRFLLERGRR